jgi:hypothetical protein
MAAWNEQQSLKFRADLTDEDGPLISLQLFALDVQAPIDVSIITDYERARRARGTIPILSYFLKYVRYDLAMISSLFSGFSGSPPYGYDVIIDPGYFASNDFTLSHLFDGLMWDQYAVFHALGITVTVPQSCDGQISTQEFGVPTRGSQGYMSCFNIDFHNPIINQIDKFDISLYALPAISKLAESMLAIGGPYCHYSLGFCHPRYSDPDVEATSKTLTRLLKREIQAILSREAAEKGWRRLEVWERRVTTP